MAEQARKASQSGEYNLAADLLRQAVAADNKNSEYRSDLGAILHALGKLEEARAVLEAGLKLNSRHAPLHDNFGVVLSAQGQYKRAADAHRRAIELDPAFARAHCNLGLALAEQGQTEEAEATLRRALQLKPRMVAVLCGLGRLLAQEPEQAEPLFRRALEEEPERITALVGLARILRSLGQFGEALRLVRRAARIKQHHAEIQVELAQTLSALSRDLEALGIYRRLLKHGMSGTTIWLGMAGCCANLGRPRQSDFWYQKTFAIDPNNRTARSGYIFMLHASALKSKQGTLRELKKWENHPGLPKDTYVHAHKRQRRRKRKLKIGYLSPDFRQHVVRQFFEPVLWNHNGDRVAVYCYSEARRPDPATWSLRWGADRWFRTHGLSDGEVAQRIYEDGIDVLIDLAGHTAHNRLGVMTFRPAPIQATYLGYFGSTGLSSIDYWITDEILHPKNNDEPVVETLYRLPRCAYCYGVPNRSPPVASRDNTGVMTFGCFNNVSKVGLAVVDTWSEILDSCPGSRLVLKDRSFAHGATRSMWKKRFKRRGIELDRIDLLPNTPHRDYLASYNSIDVALDPFPRTGGTTTCDALWMGVPVITWAGNRYAQRLSATKLSAVGAEELITNSREEYVAKAIGLAENADMRIEYHRSLRTRMLNSALGDPASLAKTLEDAYSRMLGI